MNLENYSGVYKIENTANGDYYIGSTARSFKERWASHKSNLRLGKHINPHLQNAYNLYGEDAFEFSILAVTEPEEALVLEDKILKAWNPPYNIATDAEASFLGRNHSKESREKMSESRKGKEPWNKGETLSEEHKRKLSEAHNGKHHSEKSRKKMSEAHRGQEPWNKGKHLSEETRREMSESRLGERHPMFGKHHSEESRKQMSEAHKGKETWNKGKRCPYSEETLEKMSKARKEYWRKKKEGVE